MDQAAVRQRGATLVSVLLLLLALATLALLSVRSSTRQLQSAGASVARERAWNSASAAVALARVHLSTLDAAALDGQLSGSRPQGPNCNDPCRDCLPRGVELAVDTQEPTSTCLAPPCVRPGALVHLPDASTTSVHWCQTPLRQLVTAGDADAQVSVWVRNDRAEGLDAAGWRHDANRTLVLTAVATVLGVRVVVQEQVELTR